MSILKSDWPSILPSPPFVALNYHPLAYQDMHSTQHCHNPKTDIMYHGDTFECHTFEASKTCEYGKSYCWFFSFNLGVWLYLIPSSDECERNSDVGYEFAMARHPHWSYELGHNVSDCIHLQATEGSGGPNPTVKIDSITDYLTFVIHQITHQKCFMWIWLISIHTYIHKGYPFGVGYFYFYFCFPGLGGKGVILRPSNIWCSGKNACAWLKKQWESGQVQWSGRFWA